MGGVEGEHALGGGGGCVQQQSTCKVRTIIAVAPGRRQHDTSLDSGLHDVDDVYDG